MKKIMKMHKGWGSEIPDSDKLTGVLKKEHLKPGVFRLYIETADGTKYMVKYNQWFNLATSPFIGKEMSFYLNVTQEVTKAIIIMDEYMTPLTICGKKVLLS